MTFIDKWLESVRTAPEPWITAAVIAGGALLLSGLVADALFSVTRRLLPRVGQDTFGSLRKSFRRPLQLFLFLLGLYGALHQLPLSEQTDVQLVRALRIGFILTAAYGAFHLEGLLEALLSRMDSRMNLQASELLRQFSIRIIRVLVVLLAAALVAEQFGINAAGIIAGLGIAGLAVALAAQDTRANIFAGMVLILDKPFDVGELITTEGYTGTVEKINFRSTRLRLLTQELVVIPNSAVAKGPLVNLTRRDQRRAELRLELGKGFSRHRLTAFVTELESRLKATEGIDPESVLVRLESYAVGGPVLNVAYLTATADWERFVTIRQEGIFLLMEMLERHELATARQRVAFVQEN